MGDLASAIDLKETIERYDVQNYVETGVGTGFSFSKVLLFGINTYGVELDRQFEAQYQKEYTTSTIIFGYSKDVLPNLLAQVSAAPTLFWLDAHYPNSDYNNHPYDSIKDAALRVPLEIELKMIMESRDISKDVIVIDDLRIYKEVPPGTRWRLMEPGDGKFINDMLDKTHTISEKYNHQGYAIATPS
jgi:hypothetical protein